MLKLVRSALGPLAVLSCLAVWSGETVSGLAMPSAQAVPSFGADVGLVQLSVTARAPGREAVHDLAPEEFEILEQGVRQEIVRFGHHEAPISVVVLFDKSASMSGDKLMHAKDAVVNFVRALQPHDEILVVAFSQAIDVLGDFGLDGRTIERAMRGVEAESSTRLYDAVIEGAHAIASPGRKEKRALLILSDGEDTASDATLEEAVEAVRRAGVPVYAIGIEMDRPDWAPWPRAPGRFGGFADRPPLAPEPPWRRPRQVPPSAQAQPSREIRALTRLTDGSGGWTFPTVAVQRCKEICVRVAQELRHQYLLGYRPPPAPAGAWRTVEVHTSRPAVVLSTRSGYYRVREQP